MPAVTWMQSIKRFSQQKMAWLLLFVSAAGLLSAALYFQHVMDLQPCVKCIYQRTAVIGVMFAALIPLIVNNTYTRSVGFVLWAYSAYKGLLAAREHLEVIFAENPFFAICDIVPNFPSFMPLHEWFPAIFAARGECNDNSWQFAGMGMASWLEIIFIAYLAVLAIVLVAQAFPQIRTNT
ncbi:MAG: disulfide bond formation protein DsbB [Glaciecola sp.]